MKRDTVFQILSAMEPRRQADKPFLIAIEGRCAAGKTTLAAQLQDIVHSNVFHMDDFFLPPGLRTRERLAQPGGNVDYMRFRREILLPVLNGGAFSYRPYNCHLQKQTEPVFVQPRPIGIIEGAYSCHPYLWDCYDLRIFLDIDRERQLHRIRERNGAEQLNIFQKQWIPFEEQFFSAYRIPQRCDLSFLS